MLDQETKRKIDNARDILVGKVPDPKSQVEQITIALIYKFMDDMDKESEEMGGKASFFTGDYEKYSWSKIFDPRIGGFDLLNLYGEAIVKMNQNPNIPQLFRDIFKNAFLPYRDPETLKAFLKEINEFEYDHSERLGDAFEYLLSVMDSQGGAGQFRTPRHIIDFIVSIIEPKKNETVLDPACGTAGFLISSYKHILQSNTESKKGDKLTPDERNRLLNNFVGYDISPDMVRLSLVNMYLHGFQEPHIHEYDTLTSEDRWNDTFDVILTNPPFMTPKGGIRPHNRFSIQAKRSEVLFVDYIAEHLNPGGRAAVIIPEGIIFQTSNAYKNLRKMLIENYLWAVVSLPGGIFNPYSGVKTSTLFMDKNISKKTDSILFLKIENDGYDLGAQRRPIDKNDLPKALDYLIDYKNALLKGEKIEDSEFANAVKKSKIEESGDWILSRDRYKSPSVIGSSSFPFVPLNDVCDKITDGSHYSPSTIEKGYPYITVKDIKYDKIDFNNCKFIGKDDYDKLVKNGCNPKINDILFSKDGTVGKVSLVDYNIDFVVLSSLAIVSPKIEIVKPKYIKHIFKSQNFLSKAIEEKTGVAIRRIVLRALKQIEIPLPPIEIQKEIVDEIDGYQKIIDGARQVVDNWKPTIKIDPDWEIVELGEVCEFKRGPFGGSLKKEIFVHEGYKVYEQKHAINDNFEIGKYYVTKEKYAEMEIFAVQPDDLIISCSGTMGKIAIVPADAKPGIINQALLKLTTQRERIKSEFLKYILIGDSIQKKYFRDTSGAAIQNVASVKILKTIPIPLPKISIQKNILEMVNAEREMVNINKKLVTMYEQKIKDRIAEVWGE